MGADEHPASDWSDDAERQHWAEALQAVAERERFERGVDEPIRMTVGYGALWGYYGPIRIRMAGQFAELRDEAELFDQVDSWVAFERRAGPGTRLDRDREVMDAWRARLPSLRTLWHDAAERVLRDVAATTQIRWNWCISVHEDEERFPEVPGGVTGMQIAVHPNSWAPDRRQLPFPQLWLECAGNWAIALPAPDGLADAIVHVADKVREEVMEELCTTWPPCPGHGHPLEIDASRGSVTWVCPSRADVGVEIGSLTSLEP